MAELDYAYLADYATVAEGKITAVGASFTHMFVSEFPYVAQFAIAGRIRIAADEEAPELSVHIRAEDNRQDMEVSGQAPENPNAIVYDGKIGILFTMDVGMELRVPELVTVDLSLNGEHARRLAFQLTTQADNPDVG